MARVAGSTNMTAAPGGYSIAKSRYGTAPASIFVPYVAYTVTSEPAIDSDGRIATANATTSRASAAPMNPTKARGLGGRASHSVEFIVGTVYLPRAINPRWRRDVCRDLDALPMQRCAVVRLFV